MATINLRNMPNDLHRKAKAQAALEGTTLKDLVIRLLTEYLEKEGGKGWASR
jgi:plasmid stability protein